MPLHRPQNTQNTLLQGHKKKGTFYQRTMNQHNLVRKCDSQVGHGKRGKVYLVSGHLAPSLLALDMVQQDITVGSIWWSKMAHLTAAERAKC